MKLAWAWGFAFLALFIMALVWYVARGREWLKGKSWAQGFFAWVEPIELKLYKKSETILASRALSWGAGLLAAYDWVLWFAAPLVGMDWTPVTGRVLSFVPEDLRPVVVGTAIAAIGALFERLRKMTTKPLELVAVPDTKPLAPEVEQALADAENTKLEAVATVKAAKKEGELIAGNNGGG